MTRFAAEPMKPRSLSPSHARRPLAAHYAIAGLATIGAGILQTSWTSASSAALGPLTISVILCATAWALSTAWLHWRLRAPAAPSRMTWQAILDLLVAAMTGVILKQGHLSPVAFAGLWTIPPVLLALALPSALVLLLAARIARSQQAESLTAMRLRTATGMVLLLALGWLATRPVPVIASHAVDYHELSLRACEPHYERRGVSDRLDRIGRSTGPSSARTAMTRTAG